MTCGASDLEQLWRWAVQWSPTRHHRPCDASAPDWEFATWPAWPGRRWPGHCWTGRTRTSYSASGSTSPCETAARWCSTGRSWRNGWYRISARNNNTSCHRILMKDHIAVGAPPKMGELGPRLIWGSLGPYECTSWTASLLVLAQLVVVSNAHRPRDIGNNRPHLFSQCMRWGLTVRSIYRPTIEGRMGSRSAVVGVVTALRMYDSAWRRLNLGLLIALFEQVNYSINGVTKEQSSSRVMRNVGSLVTSIYSVACWLVTDSAKSVA